MRDKQFHPTFPYRAGESPIIGLGTLHMAHGGAFAWTGNYVGFSATITDTGAGNFTVNIPVNFATAILTVHAQAITARMQPSVTLSAGPLVGGIATTNIQVQTTNDAGALADADVMLVVIDSAAMLTKKTPILAMGLFHEAALAGSWTAMGGALAAGSHPGFSATILNSGTAGDYTVYITPQAASAQFNLLVTPITADRHVNVIKTDLGAGLGTSFRLVCTDNAAAAAEADLYLTVVETMPALGESPMVAGGTLSEPGGGPGAWIDIAHPGFALTPITRNAQGDYTVTMGADNTASIVNIFVTPMQNVDAVSYISKATATTVRAVVKTSANVAVDSNLALTAFII
jgi:hypothetical protein